MSLYWKFIFEKSVRADFRVVLLVETNERAVKTDLQKPNGFLANNMPSPAVVADRFPILAQEKLALSYAYAIAQEIPGLGQYHPPAAPVQLELHQLPSLGNPIASRDGVRIWRLA